MGRGISMNKKSLLVGLGLSISAIGIIGVLATTLIGSSKPKTDPEFEQTKEMLAQTFEKNKLLSTELDRLSERHLELLKQLREKESQITGLKTETKGQVDLVKKITLLKEAEERVAGIPTWLKQDLGLDLFFSPQKGAAAPDFMASQQPSTSMDKEIQKIESFIQRRRGEVNFPAPTGTATLPAEEKEAYLKRIEILRKLLRETEVTRQTEIQVLRKRVEQLVHSIDQLEARLEELNTKGKTSKSNDHPESSKLEKNMGSAKQSDRVTFLYNLGVAYTYAGLYDSAARMYEKVLELKPDDASTHYNLGILYEEHLNQLKRGIKHYNTFLALSNDAEKNRVVRDWLYMAQRRVNQHGQSRAESARAALEHTFLTKS
jgi:tetratricopeptide (TPR) repeat protein